MLQRDDGLSGVLWSLFEEKQEAERCYDDEYRRRWRSALVLRAFRHGEIAKGPAIERAWTITVKAR
jgi:hypothetical protein